MPAVFSFLTWSCTFTCKTQVYQLQDSLFKRSSCMYFLNSLHTTETNKRWVHWLRSPHSVHCMEFTSRNDKPSITDKHKRKCSTSSQSEQVKYVNCIHIMHLYVYVTMHNWWHNYLHTIGVIKKLRCLLGSSQLKLPYMESQSCACHFNITQLWYLLKTSLRRAAGNL